MTRFRKGRKVRGLAHPRSWELGLAPGHLGRLRVQYIYRASVSGIFFTDQESHVAERSYVKGSIPSVPFALRATPDPRSAWRACYMVETPPLAHVIRVDVSEESLYNRLARGHTRVEALPGLEIITVTSWSDGADRAQWEVVKG